MSSLDERGDWPHGAAVPRAGRLRAALSEILGATTDRAVAGRTAALAFAVRVTSAGLTFLSQILLARWLGQHDYGIFAFVWVFVLMAGSLTPLGFATTAQRFIPQYRASGEMDLARGFLVGSRVFAFTLASTLALAGAVILWFVAPRLDGDYVVPLYLALACLPVFALMDVQDGISRNYNWVGLGLGLPYLARPLVILAVVGGFLVATGAADATDAAIAMAAAMWTTALLQLALLSRRLGARVERGGRRYAWRVWILTSAPIFLVESFEVLLTNADILILTAMSDASEVGIYYAAVKVLALVSFVPFAVSAAAAHKYSEYHASGETEKLRAFVRTSVAWTFWPGLATTCLFLLLGKPLLWLFGEGFGQAYPLLFIFAIGLVARASVGPADRVLTMMGQQKACAAIYGISLALNIGLNLALIPSFGLYGAAWATAVATTTESLLLFLAVRRRLGLDVFIVDTSRLFGRPGPATGGGA